MTDIINRIANMENLHWAWEKTKNFYKEDNTWFNEIEVAKFELNLNRELEKITNDIKNCKYKLTPIRPVAFPKGQDEKGKPKTRQTFWISVRDQVTWIAVLNIIGPDLDYKMPFWSYSYRLYISVFRENDEKEEKADWKFGWYRHSSKHIYRKWTQSWPLYRRNCYSYRIMSSNRRFMLSRT